MGSRLVIATATRTPKDSLSGWLIAITGDLGTRAVAISARPPDPSETRAGGDGVTVPTPCTWRSMCRSFATRPELPGERKSVNGRQESARPVVGRRAEEEPTCR